MTETPFDNICTGYGAQGEHITKVPLKDALCPSCEAVLDASLKLSRIQGEDAIYSTPHDVTEYRVMHVGAHVFTSQDRGEVDSFVAHMISAWGASPDRIKVEHRGIRYFDWASTTPAPAQINR